MKTHCKGRITEDYRSKQERLIYSLAFLGNYETISEISQIFHNYSIIWFHLKSWNTWRPELSVKIYGMSTGLSSQLKSPAYSRI